MARDLYDIEMMTAAQKLQYEQQVPPLMQARPRERMLLMGSSALSEVELIALLLGGGHAIARSLRLLQQFGGLRGLVDTLPQELLACPGVGEASATAICAAIELARRIGKLELSLDRALRHPQDVIQFARFSLHGATQEIFLILGLDSRQRVRLVREVARGTIANVEVHPREIFRPLIRAGSHSVILVHNHPSGDPTPSVADIELTKRLTEAGWLLGIPVLDHLIVTDFACISMADLQIMPESEEE